jgi:hypothetical protein
MKRISSLGFSFRDTAQTWKAKKLKQDTREHTYKPELKGLKAGGDPFVRCFCQLPNSDNAQQRRIFDKTDELSRKG